MDFKYVQNNTSEIENITMLQEILSKEKILLDSKYLPVMEQAEKGDFNSIAEMATIFSDGAEGLKPNYSLAKRYTDMGLEIVKKSEDKVSILEVLTNSAIIEAKFDNHDNSKLILKKHLNLYFLNSLLKKQLEYK